MTNSSINGIVNIFWVFLKIANWLIDIYRLLWIVVVSPFWSQKLYLCYDALRGQRIDNYWSRDFFWFMQSLEFDIIHRNVLEYAYIASVFQSTVVIHIFDLVLNNEFHLILWRHKYLFHLQFDMIKTKPMTAFHNVRAWSRSNRFGIFIFCISSLNWITFNQSMK